MPQTPVFRSAGAWTFTPNNVAAASTIATVAPAGKTVGDLLILVVESRGIATAVTTPSGWTPITGSPFTSGTASGGRIWVFTRTADGTAADTPTVSYSGATSGTTGDSTGAGILCYQNSLTATLDGTPATSDLAAQVGTSSVNGETTTKDQSLVLLIAMKIIDFSGANSVSAGWTERVDALTTSGTGHGLEIAEKIVSPAGASGSATVTWGLATSARAFGVAIGFTAALAAFVDAATMATSSTPSTGEVAPSDSATIGTTTTLSSVESYNLQLLLPIADISVGSWTASGGAVPLYSMIDETIPSDSDYIAYPNFSSGTTGVYRTQLASGVAPTSATLHVRMRDAAVALVGEIQISIYQAGTLKEQYAVNPDGTFTTYDHTITVANFTDWSDIEISISGALIDVGSFTPQVSWIALETSGIAPTGTTNTDSGTISSKTTPSGSDVAAFGETVTAIGTTTQTSIDTAQVLDSATVSGVTTPITVQEGREFPDSQTISSTTSLTSVDVLAAVEAQTVASKTAPSAVEVHEIPDAATVSGVTSVSATEIAAFTNAATIAGTTSLSTIDIHEIPDSGTISGSTTLSGSDVAAYVDSGTIVSNSSGTSGIELAAFSDFSTIPGVTGVISDEQFGHGTFTFTDSDTTSTQTTLTYTEVAGYADAATSASTTSCSATEFRVVSDAATVNGTSILSGIEQAQYIEASTIAMATTPSATEIREITDTGTGSTKTTVTSTEVIAFVDAQIVSSVTSVTGVEGPTTGNQDANTVVDTTTPSAAELAAFSDQNTISGKTGLNYVEGGVADINTIPVFTIPAASDIAAFGDSGVPNNVTSLSAVEQAVDQDTSVINSISAISYSELVTYVESATFSSKTQPGGSEFLQHPAAPTTFDANTISTKSNLSYSEQAIYVEAGTVVSYTTSSDIQNIIFSESATIKSSTFVEATEFAKAPAFDAATISSITTPGVIFEYAIRLNEIIVVSYYIRWQATSTSSRWLAPVRSFIRWDAKPLKGRFTEKVSRKWAAWIP